MSGKQDLAIYTGDLKCFRESSISRENKEEESL